jgi:hypothetical protein
LAASGGFAYLGKDEGLDPLFIFPKIRNPRRGIVPSEGVHLREDGL